MVWLGQRRGNLVDWVTQRWVQWTGRRVAVADAPWLGGPTGSTHIIGHDFFERWGAERGLRPLAPSAEDGLIEGLSALRGPGFEPSSVSPEIDAFYAETAAFDLDIRSRWSGPFRLFGWLIAKLFARRLAQFNMPLSDRALKGGVDSRIVRLADAHGRVRSTAWVRTAAESGLPLFVGQYGTEKVPGHPGPCIKVVFPLPNGNAMIMLRPRAETDGGFALVSDGRVFGDPGFYFTVVASEGELWARYVRTMKETLTLRTDGDVVSARHRFRVFGLPFLELRYRIRRKGRLSGASAVATLDAGRPQSAVPRR